MPSSQLGLRWQKIAAANKVSGSLQAIAKINLQTGRVRNHLTVALQMQHPSRLRVESIPVIGPPDFFLSLSEKNLKIFLPGKKEFYVGLPTQKNLLPFLPLNLPPKDFVAALMGIPGLPAVDKIIGFQETVVDGRLEMKLFLDDKRTRTMWFASGSLRFLGMEILDSAGDVIRRTNYGAYRQFGDTWLPEQVTIFARERNTRLLVSYTEMELITPGDEGMIFDLPVPPGVTPLILDAEDRQWIND